MLLRPGTRLRPIGRVRAMSVTDSEYTPPTPTAPTGAPLAYYYVHPSNVWQDTAGTTPSAAIGDPVARVDDLSGNGQHLLQSTSSRRPTLQLDYRGCYYLKFDRRLVQNVAATFTLPQPYSRAVALRFQRQGTAQAALDGKLADTAYLSRQTNGTIQMYAGTSLFAAGVGAATDGTTEQVVQVYDGASSKLYRGGSEVVTGNAGSAAAGGVTVGANGGQLYAEDMDFYRMAIYGTAADATTAGLLDTWLQLPAATTYTLAATAGDGLLLNGTNSGLTLAATAPTKDAANPVFDTLPVSGAAADHDKLWLTPIEDGTGGVKLWLGVGDNNPSPTLGWTYQTSADGRTGWTRPNLGQVTISGNTNNNFIGSRPLYFTSLDYDAVNGRYVASVELWSGGNGVRVYTSTDGLTWTLAKTLSVDPYDGEGAGVLILPDGRVRLYALRGQQTGLRHTCYYESLTSDMTGDWIGWRYVPEWRYAGDVTRQTYRANIRRVRGGHLCLMTYLNGTTERMWVEPWATANAGETWTQLATDGWLPQGTSGAWDDALHLAAGMVTLGTDEHLIYFTGGAEDHNTYPRTSQVGVSSVAAGKLVKLSGTGTFTTVTGSIGGLSLRVDADGTGGSVRAAVLNSGGGVISGYDTTDMTSITGDVYSQLISWGGNSAMPASAAKVRFTVTSAILNGWRIA